MEKSQSRVAQVCAALNRGKAKYLVIGGVACILYGYARATGKPGVLLVTSGPGATNVMTGLTSALMDSIPVVALTGQVPAAMIGKDGFQEADTIGISLPCTKQNFAAKSAAEIPSVIQRAFKAAVSGRPGPVLDSARRAGQRCCRPGRR